MREFPYAINCLEQIVSCWEQGKHVVVQVVDPELDVSDDEDILIDGDISGEPVNRYIKKSGYAKDEYNITDTDNGDVSSNEDDACVKVNNGCHSKESNNVSYKIDLSDTDNFNDDVKNNDWGDLKDDKANGVLEIDHNVVEIDIQQNSDADKDVCVTNIDNNIVMNDHIGNDDITTVQSTNFHTINKAEAIKNNDHGNAKDDKLTGVCKVNHDVDAQQDPDAKEDDACKNSDVFKNGNDEDNDKPVDDYIIKDIDIDGALILMVLV